MSEKKEIRRRFRDACFARDKYCCAKCGLKSCQETAKSDLDAHHITDRNLMPNGGYVLENGISLCAACHIKAETYHLTGIPYEGYSADDLYAIIKSSYDLARKKSSLL